MGLDRTDDAEDTASAADRLARSVPAPGRGGEIPGRDGHAVARGERERGADAVEPRTPGEVPGGKLDAGDRVAAQLRARTAAGTVYADWEQKAARTEEGPPDKPARLLRADGNHPDRDARDAHRGHHGEDPAGGGDSPSRSPDALSAAEEALRRRVSELEADKADSGRRLAGYEARLADQDKTIAEQGKGMARLEAELGRVAAVLDGLRGEKEEPRASGEIEGRYRGEEAERPEWGKAERKRGLPTDAVNNAVSIAVGSAITALPYQVHGLPPEGAGLAAGGLAFGAGIIAVWREHRKAKHDDVHRPEN